MTSSVSTIGSSHAAPQQAPAGAAISALTTSTAAASSPDVKLPIGNPNAPISPRIVVDPLAGVITEFLSEDGAVQSQIPSAAVVAYLRAGLTSTGLVKQSPETQHDHKSESQTLLA